MFSRGYYRLGLSLNILLRVSLIIRVGLFLPPRLSRVTQCCKHVIMSATDFDILKFRH